MIKSLREVLGSLVNSFSLLGYGNQNSKLLKLHSLVWQCGFVFLSCRLRYYDPVVLRKIGEAIGPVLRIDAHTANGARGRFAQLCVQVNLDKPLIKTVKIGRLAQIVLYEGLNSLYFECGRIGHRKETCPHVIKGPQVENPQGTQANSNSFEE